MTDRSEPREDDEERADREAVEWLILLREAGDEASADFEAWLLASPANRKAWADTAYSYDLAANLRPTFVSPLRAVEKRPVVPFVPRNRNRAAARAKRRRSLPRLRSIAMVATAVAIAVVAAPTLRIFVVADHTTGVGQLETVHLADGSTAELGPRSAITVTYAANRRQVRLLRGQAWFDVRHDVKRPFYVQADAVTTSVLGTAFEVKLAETGVVTQVSRGRVRVDLASSAPPVSQIVSTGSGVRVGFDGSVEQVAVSPEQIAAWRNRQIIVQNRPVGEVVEAIRPWYGGLVIVRLGALSQRRVTGVFNVDDPVGALKALTTTVGGSVLTATPYVTVLSDT